MTLYPRAYVSILEGYLVKHCLTGLVITPADLLVSTARMRVLYNWPSLSQPSILKFISELILHEVDLPIPQVGTPTTG